MGTSKIPTRGAYAGQPVWEEAYPEEPRKVPSTSTTKIAAYASPCLGVGDVRDIALLV